MSRRRKSLPPEGWREGIELELLHHIEERTDRLIARGWDEREARAEAERRFGDLARWRAELVARDTGNEGRRRMMGIFDTLAQDVRYALRSIRRNPGFAAALLATLALGIGATGAVFSVVDAVMLRPLPYRNPHRIVDAQLRLPSDFRLPELDARQIVPWTGGADFLQAVAPHGRLSMVRTDGAEPELLSVLFASPELDEVLGIGAAMGRTFGPDDALPGTRSLVMSWAYWSRTGRDPDVLGHTMELDGERWTVVGVLPRGVKYPVAGTYDVWAPLASDLTAAGRTLARVGMVGRLANGIDLRTAQERADALGSALARTIPLETGWSVELTPVDDWRGNPDTRRGLWMVAGAVGLMFLITLFNALNLLLVRAHTRVSEVGMRKALGASRIRVVRQILAESVLLSLLGGGVATVLAWLCVAGIGLIAPEELTFGMVHEFGIERRALGMIFLVATATGLVVGLAPALRLAATRVRDAGAGLLRGPGRGSHRIRTLFVGAEIAASVVLLVGASLFLRSFAAMYATDTGMDADRLAFAVVQLPSTRYETAGDRADFVRETLTRIRAAPGVASAVAAQGVPPAGAGFSFGVALEAEGSEPLPGDRMIPFASVPEEYFETLGARLSAGRPPRPEDDETGGVVINRTLARQLFGDAMPVGRRFRLSEDGEWMTVVGVVEALRLGGVDDRLGSGAILRRFDPDDPPTYLTFAVRANGRPQDLLPAIRGAIFEVDDRLPLVTLETGREALGDDARRPRFLVLLVSVLAGVALLLASVGVYGVLSYTVRQRRREVGIRIALGAPLGRVRAGLLRWGLGVAIVGTGVGVWVAALLDDFASSLLYGITPGDVASRAVAALMMIGVTFAACLLPTRRATRVDPVEVLKAE